MSTSDSSDDPEAIRAEIRTLRIRILELRYQRDALLAANPTIVGVTGLPRALWFVVLVVMWSAGMVAVLALLVWLLWAIAGMGLRG